MIIFSTTFFYRHQIQYMCTHHKEIHNLDTNGFVVVPCIDAIRCASVRSKLDAEVRAFPEFHHMPAGHRLVLGGFGALANASSFHNKTVRKLRVRAMNKAIEPLRTIAKTGDRLEQVIDRLMIRRSGDSVTAESWHRDVCPTSEPGDRIFGGWIT